MAVRSEIILSNLGGIEHNNLVNIVDKNVGFHTKPIQLVYSCLIMTALPREEVSVPVADW